MGMQRFVVLSFLFTVLTSSLDANEPRNPREFSCWSVVKNPEGSEEKWSVIRDQVISDQGGRFEIQAESGEAYWISLSQLTYQEEIDVLKLGVHRQGETKTISYTWANPEAEMLGINLGWIQASCRLKR